ncbi:hypothetical protein Btru_051483 [Bulinus truncatus]|nr:hypothetical protein Btru_051483 [Bulinus truncatus]
MAKFDSDVFQGLLSTSKIGRKLLYEEVTGSTMDDARRLGHNVAEYPHGTAVLSERQTKARGAKNHTWDAANMGNIYISFILHLPPVFKTHEGKNDLEVAACLAVLQTIHNYGVSQAVPKWPNDIWVKGHKLAGFLVEDGRFDIPGSLNCLLILGMGINVNADVRRSAELNSIATSLICERDGQSVCREKFLADVCTALETRLQSSQEDLLSEFKTLNLFHEQSKILVSFLSGGTVVDAEFLEICNNWDIKFLDNASGKIMCGSSEDYSVRPKVISKILVISSGLQNTSAACLSKWFMSIVDTSKYVVCLVPESAITSSDAWMKNCSLLVIAEQVHEPDLFWSKVNGYIEIGGSVLSNGLGSLFLAKHLGIQTKEFLLDSNISDSDVEIVFLQILAQLESLKQESDNHCSCEGMPANDNILQTYAEPIIFPTGRVCFQFYEDEKALLSESSILQKKNSTDCIDTLDTLHIGSGDHSQYSITGHKGCSLRAFYMSGDKKCKTQAIFTSKSSNSGKVGLLGFDAGVEYPTVLNDSPETTALYADRFKRDKLMMQVLNVLLE